MQRHLRRFQMSALAAGMLASGLAVADARLGADLLQRLNAAKSGEPLTVVVTYEQNGPADAADLSVLQQLGITRTLRFHSLPIVGVQATASQVQALAQRDDVLSIHLNRSLQYMNHESRQISGAARVVERPQEFNRAIPYSGAGVTVVVHDSGVDATHMDLKFGEHVVENVQGITNLAAWDPTLPITYLEGMPNSDISSGHGTHVAGTVGGTGERSAGRHRGVAPGADLVGYGSGAAIAVLDAIGGFDYAITNQNRFDHPIRVITNSWGSSGPFDPSDPVNVASYEAYKRGMVVLFAAGNDGPGEDTHNPYAQAPWVISVGAGEKNGVLTDFSSRGKRGERGDFTTADGRAWTYVNEPTIVATGVDIVSTRTLTGALPPLAAELDAALIPPAQLPFYTVMSGTSMATPHAAGIVALMLEANPSLTPDQVKGLLAKTATNMTGRASWEAGAGHVNAYAAVAAAQGLRTDYGATVNTRRTFNSEALVVPGRSEDFSVDFLPVGPVEEHAFTVGADVAWITARATIGENTLAVVLIDPDGERYGSAISLPALGSTVTATAPAKPGTWKVTVRGIGSISGVAVDPAGVSNGVGAPGTIDGTLTFLNSGGFRGLSDIAGHPARGAIEYAVSQRLVDGYANGTYKPDVALNRGDLAQYLLMGASLRQSLPFGTTPTFYDVPRTNPYYAYAEAAVAPAAPLRDLGQAHDGVMRLIGGQFRPTSPVTRTDLAYALAQSFGLQAEARAFSGDLTVQYDGRRVPVEDAASIPANLRGYVQLALDRGFINARFVLRQGPFDLQPTIVAYFDGGGAVSRAAYAVAIGRYDVQYRVSVAH